MWIMTPFGFITPAARAANSIEPGDLRGLQVRARDRRALAHLKRHYLPTLGNILATPERDYEYRAYCTHSAFAVAMSRLVATIDYEKFKPQTEVVLGEDEGGKLHSLYIRIWGVIAEHYESPILGRYYRTAKPQNKRGPKVISGRRASQ